MSIETELSSRQQGWRAQTDTQRRVKNFRQEIRNRTFRLFLIDAHSTTIIANVANLKQPVQIFADAPCPASRSTKALDESRR